jgi:hypothetical protein
VQDRDALFPGQPALVKGVLDHVEERRGLEHPELASQTSEVERGLPLKVVLQEVVLDVGQELLEVPGLGLNAS